MIEKTQDNEFKNYSGLLLSEPEMLAQLQHRLPVFSQIEWLRQTGSTNVDLMQRAKTSKSQMARPWLLGSHLQTAGRGRVGRTWHNKAGSNLMFSCAFDVFIKARELATITSFIGTITCQALRPLLYPDLQKNLSLKWPNDILWDNAKLAGMLIESTRASTSKISDHHLVVIGLGMNLDNASQLSHELHREVADWNTVRSAHINHKSVGVIKLVTTLANAWYQGLNQVSSYGFNNLSQEYAKYDALLGQPVNIIDNGRILHTGIASGIDNQGHLLVKENGQVLAISVGEVSVRAIV